MSAEPGSELKFEIGHVLFIDIVGYSKLFITEQRGQLQRQNEPVHAKEKFPIAAAERKPLRLPTGDGGALDIRTSPEPRALCALASPSARNDRRVLRLPMPHLIRADRIIGHLPADQSS